MRSEKNLQSNSRLNIRLPEAAKLNIEKAATISGVTTTDFAINALTHSAELVLRSYETRSLSDRDRDAFLAMLETDKHPNSALKAAARRYKRAAKK